MIILKGSYVCGELKHGMNYSVQKPYLAVQDSKLPLFMGAVQGREWKYVNLRAYQSPWYRVCTKAILILKGSYMYGELKNVIP